MSNELKDLASVTENHTGQVKFAYRLARAFEHRLIFVHGIGWHHWNGTHWAKDEDGEARRAVLDVLAKALVESLGDKSLRRDIEKCESASGIEGVLAVASNLTELSRTVSQLDVDPYLLNTASGTVDLRTGELRAHDPHDLITKVTRAAYRRDAVGDGWEGFLAVVLPNPEVRGYFQRLIGLSLLGKVQEHIFTIATGTGANGKGTAYNAILHALGDYGHAAESDLFMSGRSNPNGATPALMGLLGKRLVVVSETERDHRLATALMKNLTGGDPITARPLYGSPVTFEPSHTSLMVTNYLPKVAGDDPAAWRRIRVIPFDVVIPETERDPRLGDRLNLEADAILMWAIAGYRDYADHGLQAPDAVKAATDTYMKDMDAVARFIEDCCLLFPHAYAETGDLHRRWISWAVDEGAEPLSMRAFGDALTKHGHPVEKRGGRSLRTGIGLQSEEESEDGGPRG